MELGLELDVTCVAYVTIHSIGLEITLSYFVLYLRLYIIQNIVLYLFGLCYGVKTPSYLSYICSVDVLLLIYFVLLFL